MKKNLLVLAAGMGSRYGGLKQMDPVGPSGEFILDYSVYDALRAGFDSVVFVIRKDIEDDFRKFVGQRWERCTDVQYAFQSLSDIPAGFVPPEGRMKPWGTGQAVLAARTFLSHPFAVVNADDFYGAESYRTLADFFEADARNGAEQKFGAPGIDASKAYAMVAYELAKTLSEYGTVSRGVCEVDGDGFLVSMVEHTAIGREADGLIYSEDNVLAETTPVSMNFFGFRPSFVEALAEEFPRFLRNRGGEFKSEFLMPTMAGKMVAEKCATIKVFRSASEWFGVTNREDRPFIVSRLAELAQQGRYPSSLFPPLPTNH